MTPTVSLYPIPAKRKTDEMKITKKTVLDRLPMFCMWFLFTAAGVILDQITKIIAVSDLKGQGEKQFIPYIFDLIYVENRGAAWGMFADHRWVFMSISTIAVILMSAALFAYAKEHKMFCISLAAVISGGVGNMIDRVVNGYVVDFLQFSFYPDFPVFNVADIFVTVGCICLAVYMIFFDKTIFREEKKLKEEDADAENG